MTDGLSTERLQIEPLRLDHAAEWHAALADERVGTYIGGPDATTVAELEPRISFMLQGPPDPAGTERWWNWMVRLAPDQPDGGTVIGRIQATTYGTWAEIAYVFGPRWWGRGYATEASIWLLDHLRSTMGITETWVAIHPDNLASVRLAERLGHRRVNVADRELGSFDDGDLVLVRRA